jgi:hypothetical protein
VSEFTPILGYVKHFLEEFRIFRSFFKKFDIPARPIGPFYSLTFYTIADLGGFVKRRLSRYGARRVYEPRHAFLP